jgi:predicted phage baseplate assembly protein
MPLAPPNLDTRRWAELVDEARIGIARTAPRWTDHNVHDPGITLVELLAAVTDQAVFRLNRVPAPHRAGLLRLVGFGLRGPSAATGIVVVRSRPGAPDLPAGLVLDAANGACRLTAPLAPVAAPLVAVTTGTAAVDSTRAVFDGEPVIALGADGDGAVAFGFDGTLPAGRTVSLGLVLDAGGDGPRAAGLAKQEADLAVAAPPLPDAHHGAGTVWETLTAGGWVALPSAAVVDPTRALTRTGVVHLTPAQDITRHRAEPAGPALAWIRCRVHTGRHDAAPVLLGAAADAVPVAFAVRTCRSYVIDAAAAVPAAPLPAEAPLAFDLDASGRITALVSDPSLPTPPVRVWHFSAPAGGLPGALTVEAAHVGVGDGTPLQRIVVDGGPFVDDSVVAWTKSGATLHPLDLHATAAGFAPTALGGVVEPEAGAITFGDGRHGAVLPLGTAVLAAGDETNGGRSGRLSRSAPLTIRRDVRNESLLGQPVDVVAGAIGEIVLLATPSGGADAEDVGDAAARAEASLWAHERLTALLDRYDVASLDAVDAGMVRSTVVPRRGATLADLERIALGVRGTQVARAHAIARHDARYPCIDAAGVVTVVIVPWLPSARPEPTPALLGVISAALGAARLVGTQVRVVGPTYVVVDATVSVVPVAGADAGDVRAAVVAALTRYLHPLTGGPAGNGWPFGRDVHRADVLRVVDAAAGVDHAVDLSLAVSGEPATCGSVCVGPLSLAVAGVIDVTIVEGSRD